MPAPLPLNDGDNSFVGVNSKLSPDQIPPGLVSEAINLRFDKGVATPRKGIKKIGFANIKNTSSSPTSLNNNKLILNVNQGLSAYDTIKGIGKFQDVSGFSWLLVATTTKVYALRDGNPPRELKTLTNGDPSLPTSYTTSTANANKVDFIQCFNKVIMFRGESVPPLQLEDVDLGWRDISKEDTRTDFDENDSDGTESIPNSAGGSVYMQNRLFVIDTVNRDLIAASDVANPTRYQPILQAFRINVGSEDSLVALHKYDETTLLCFKEHSVYAIRNVYGNLSDCYLDQLTDAYGLVASKAVTSVGKDVWFLSDQRGVVSLSISESGKVQGVDAPASEAIQPVIDRISWPYSHLACSAYHDSKYWLAVPLDNSRVNNAILCYDFKMKAWSGFDQGTAINGISEFITYKYQGKKRLFFSTSDFINLYNDDRYCGAVDELVTTSTDTGKNITTEAIETSLTTRGYKCNLDSRKRFRATGISFDTNGVVGTNKGITAKLIFDGIKEETTVFSDKNYSRTKYSRPFDKADYVISNSGDDYLDPYREDYSLALAGSEAIEPGTNGFDPDALQESTHKNYINGDGTFVQLKITNNVGSCTVKSVAVGATPHDTKLIEKR